LNRNLPDIGPEDRRLLYRNDLSSFIGLVFRLLNPDTPFLHNWHIDRIATALEACDRGESDRLIICMPPRNLKSICTSVAYTAWALGRNPSAQILCVSYNQDLANKHALDTRRVMTSPEYLSIFPGTRLASDRSAVEEFTTTRGGFRFATSVGGTLTGRGGDIILIDDPLKPDEAVSEVSRERVNNWYGRTLLSRLNQKQAGCIILIMQRLHENDLAGYLQSTGKWDLLSLPAIAEVEERHDIKQFGRSYTKLRRVGEALHPEREPLTLLEEYKQALGSYAWASQYQQSPAPLGGGMVKDAWWGLYSNEPETYDQTIQSWDTANKPSELSDYSVCTTWGRKGPNTYLRHVYRQRVGFPDLKRAVRELRDLFKPARILIEDKASGVQLVQELQQEGIYQITPIKPLGDKIMRMNAQTARIENGFVWLPKEAPWLADYRAEMSAFPNGRFDDQVDSTSQALAWMHEESIEPGIYSYYKYLARLRYESGQAPHFTQEQIDNLYVNFWEPEEDRIKNLGRRGPDNRLLRK
jgi:predicted phage terminase large subunit-like protein